MSDLPLYWRHPELLDCYCRIFDARPAPKGGTDTWDLILENSPFYPGGGGQPSDRGIIGEEPLLEIVRSDEGHVHRVKSDRNLSQARTIRCRVDELYRRDSMQQHSGQHLLSAALAKEGLDTVSVHLGADYCGIEVDAASVADDIPERVLERCDAWIARDLPILSRIVDPEDESINRLRRPLKSSGDKVRIIEIDEVDAVGCGGVHLESTRSVIGIIYSGSEKLRGRSRLKWIIGDRVIRQARHQSGIVDGLCRELSVEPEEIAERLEAIMARTRKAEGQLSESEKQLGNLLCRQAFTNYPDGVQSGDVILVAEIGGGSDRMQGALDNARSLGVKAALFLGEAESGDPQPWGMHLRKDLSGEFDRIRRELISPASGRGGGHFPFWRGVFPAGNKRIQAEFRTMMESLDS